MKYLGKHLLPKHIFVINLIKRHLMVSFLFYYSSISYRKDVFFILSAINYLGENPPPEKGCETDHDDTL